MPDPNTPSRVPLARALVFALAFAFGSLVAAQDPAEEPKPKTKAEQIGAALLQWVADFEAGKVQVQAGAFLGKNTGVDYIDMAVDTGVFVVPKTPSRTTHFTLLQRLVTLAETHPSAATAQALLALAAMGFAKDMFQHTTMMVRDLGHFALLRVEAPVVWNYVYERATKPPRRTSLSGFDYDSRVMWRVAAIRLLGYKAKGVFRSSIEKCLSDEDSRVRLGAAESLGFLAHKSSLPALTRALATEAHPMVVVALVQGMQKVLNKHAIDIPEQVSELALQTALGRLSKVGWRSDMAIIQLLHNHPIKAAVPRLIGVMRQARGEEDPILKIINENASLMLSHEAHRALRRITGAMVPNDPDKWVEFWQKEQDHLKVTRRGPADRQKTFAKYTGGSFYGIPVLGNDVVFVIDTSRSMKTRVKPDPKRPKTGKRRKRIYGTRLHIAVRQTLKAIQGMTRRAKFTIVTFNSTVRKWNKTPVKVRPGARSRAASILSYLKPEGGTNVFDALIQVLEGANVGYGEMPATGVDEVFVLSDGEPSAGVLTDTEEILRVVKEVNKVRKIRIHTVFAGAATGNGAAFMKKLAEQNGGQFVQQ